MGVLDPNYTVVARRAVLAAIRSRAFDVADLPAVAHPEPARWVITRLRHDHAPLPAWAARQTGVRTYAQLVGAYAPPTRRLPATVT